LLNRKEKEPPDVYYYTIKFYSYPGSLNFTWKRARETCFLKSASDADLRKKSTSELGSFFSKIEKPVREIKLFDFR